MPDVYLFLAACYATNKPITSLEANAITSCVRTSEEPTIPTSEEPTIPLKFIATTSLSELRAKSHDRSPLLPCSVCIQHKVLFGVLV